MALDALSPTESIEFLPRRILANAHLQTVLSNLPAQSRIAPPWVRQSFEVPLRDSTDRLLAIGYWQPRPAPTVIVLHGVGGGSDATYVLQAVQALLAQGFNAVALNFRGAGAGAPLAHKMYHSGLYSDVEDAVLSVKGMVSLDRIGLLGFSLGGQIALRLASTWASKRAAPARAIATISAPFDLQAACEKLDRGPYWPYRKHIMRGLLANCQRPSPAGQRRLPVPFARIANLKKLQEFDDLITAPMHGFADAKAFYAEASCGPRLQSVHVPTLSIHAMDDPVVPMATLSTYRAQASDAIRFLWTQHGGHIGFVSAWRHLKVNWALMQSIRFFSQNLTERT